MERCLCVVRGRLVEVGAAEEIAAGAADELAAAVFEASGAGGAVDAMMFGRGVQRADFGGLGLRVWFCAHADRIARVGSAANR